MQNSREYTDHLIVPAGYTGPVAVYFGVPTMPPLPVDELAGVRRIVVNAKGYAITSSKRSGAKAFKVFAEVEKGERHEIKYDDASENQYYFTKYSFGARNMIPAYDENVYPGNVPSSVATINFFICTPERCEILAPHIVDEQYFKEAGDIIDAIYGRLKQK